MSLFLDLRKHGKLAEKRNPMYEKSKFGKFWMYFMFVFWAGYLIFFGTTFAFAFDGGATEAYHVMNSGLIFVLVLDFLIRLPFQKTPTQEVKPYLLLPIKRNRLIDFLLIRSGLDGFNLFWLFLFVPFSIITVTKFYGISGVLTYCIGIWLLMVFNNYWFLLCRTLMGERIWWLALPVVVYGGIAAALFIPDNSPLFDCFVNLGEGFITGNILSFIGVLAAIALMWFINRTLMQKLIYNELNKVEDTRIKHVSEYKFLDRYGEIGEYMRLELKLLLRNKICKRSLYSITGVVIMFSSIISFSDVYDGGLRDFFVLYNYIIFGIMFLSTLMGYEGNYIDGLMSRKESIYSLLRAKYILYSIAHSYDSDDSRYGYREGIRTRLHCMADIHSGSRILLSVPTGSLQQQDYRPEFKDDQPAEYRHRSAESDFRRCFRHTFTAAFCTECHLWQRGHPLDTYRHRRGIHRHFQILADECISPTHETPLQEYGRLQGQ